MFSVPNTEDIKLMIHLETLRLNCSAIEKEKAMIEKETAMIKKETAAFMAANEEEKAIIEKEKAVIIAASEEKKQSIELLLKQEETKQKLLESHKKDAELAGYRRESSLRTVDYATLHQRRVSGSRVTFVPHEPNSISKFIEANIGLLDAANLCFPAEVTGVGEAAVQGAWSKKIPGLMVNENCKSDIIDTHSPRWLTEKAPDLQFVVKGLVASAQHTASIGDLKARFAMQKNVKCEVDLIHTDATRGQLETYNELILDACPCRNMIYGFVTNSVILAVVRSERGVGELAGTIHHVWFFDSKLSSKAGNRMLTAFFMADPSILGYITHTIPRKFCTPSLEAVDVFHVKYLGKGASSTVYHVEADLTDEDGSMNRMPCVAKTCCVGGLWRREKAILQYAAKTSPSAACYPSYLGDANPINVDSGIDGGVEEKCEKWLLLFPLACNFTVTTGRRPITSTHMELFLQAIKDLHFIGVAHGDPRIPNLLWLSPDSVLLNDFGNARVIYEKIDDPLFEGVVFNDFADLARDFERDLTTFVLSMYNLRTDSHVDAGVIMSLDNCWSKALSAASKVKAPKLHCLEDAQRFVGGQASLYEEIKANLLMAFEATEA